MDRVRFLSKVVLAVSVSLALALTCSCSSDIDPEDGGNEGNSGTFTDNRDGNVYKWVKIDKQIWMAENLNFNVNGSKCYDNDPANCVKYGRLYNWSMAMNACPTGWRLPSDTEWNALMIAVGGSSTAGIKLKATNGWYDPGYTYIDIGDYIPGTDSYGFSALPSGYSEPSGFFGGLGIYASWWSASSADNTSAVRYFMFYDAVNVGKGSGFITNFNSIRCMHN